MIWLEQCCFVDLLNRKSSMKLQQVSKVTFVFGRKVNDDYECQAAYRLAPARKTFSALPSRRQKLQYLQQWAIASS